MKAKLVKNRTNQLVLPFLLFLGTTIYLLAAFQIKPQVDEGLVGPSFIPVLTSILMYIALFFVLKKILQDQLEQPKEKESLWPFIQMVIATAAYILLFKVLGYPISTFLYTYVMLYIFDLKETTQIKRILYSALITVIFYVLYSVIFQVRLPMLKGVL